MARAAVLPPPATSCTADIAFSHVFAITSAVSLRNSHLKQQCAGEGLRCTLVPDVPKDLLDVTKLQRMARTSTFPTMPYIPSLPRYNLSAGDFACALAHRNVYDLIHMNSIPCALVLENDIKLTSHFEQHVRRLDVAWSTSNAFDVLKLQRCVNSDKGPRPIALSRTIKTMEGHGGPCTSAYIITLEAARRVRRAQTPGMYPFRLLSPTLHPLFSPCRLTPGALSPQSSPCATAPSGSGTGASGRRTHREPTTTRQIVQGLPTAAMRVSRCECFTLCRR